MIHPDLASLTTSGLYLAVFALVFIESGLLVGFFLPGDTLLFAVGLLAAQQSGNSRLSLPVLTIGVAVAAVAGDAVGYWSGRRWGRPWLQQRTGRLARHLPQHLARAEAFYDRWGWSAVVAARFIPWVRTFTPIIAGISRMRYRAFLSANIIGALLWGSGLILLGYVAYSLPWVRYVAYSVAAVAIAASIVGPVFAAIKNRNSSPGSGE